MYADMRDHPWATFWGETTKAGIYALGEAWPHGKGPLWVTA